jgi:mediator of RNA polymerase II transcription subunit 14
MFLQTIADLAEQKARYLGMQCFRKRNFLQDEFQKLGDSTRGTLFIQLAAFPTHYLVIVVMDLEYRYALISTSIVPDSMFGNMIMEDIAWLDLARIHGDEAVRAVSANVPPGGHTGRKRKRSQDPELDSQSIGGYVNRNGRPRRDCLLTFSLASNSRPLFYANYIVIAG